MKLNVIIFSAVLFVSCGAGTGENAKSDTAAATQQAIVNTGGVGVDSANNMSGSNLIAANDCLTCHKIDGTSNGPSYRQIAAKYDLNEGNIENLAYKIIKGGKGLWGQNAMTPHPNLPRPQAQEMVRYILTLRDSSATIK